MKNVIIMIMMFSIVVFAEDSSDILVVGMEAPSWIFKDADGKDYTMDTWKGKILQINY